MSHLKNGLTPAQEQVMLLKALDLVAKLRTKSDLREEDFSELSWLLFALGIPFKSPFIRKASNMKKDTQEAIVETITEEIGNEVARRNEDPCGQQLFHLAMLKELPKRAVIRRAWHQWMARRWKAKCEAKERGYDC